MLVYVRPSNEALLRARVPGAQVQSGSFSTPFYRGTLRVRRMVWRLLSDPPQCAYCSFNRVAWLILDCARRTSTFLSCAFREQEDGQATLPILRRPRVARAQKIISLHPLLCSASKKGTWPLLSHPLSHIPLAVEATLSYEPVW
jgi:hypothetical protein